MRLEKFKKKKQEPDIEEELEEEEEEEEEEEDEDEEELEEEEEREEEKKKHKKGDIEPIYSVVGFKVYKNEKEFIVFPAEQEALAIFVSDIYKKLN